MACRGHSNSSPAYRTCKNQTWHVNKHDSRLPPSIAPPLASESPGCRNASPQGPKSHACPSGSVTLEMRAIGLLDVGERPLAPRFFPIKASCSVQRGHAKLLLGPGGLLRVQELRQLLASRKPENGIVWLLEAMAQIEHFARSPKKCLPKQIPLQHKTCFLAFVSTATLG